MLSVVTRTVQVVISMLDNPTVISFTLGLPWEGVKSLCLHLVLLHLWNSGSSFGRSLGIIWAQHSLQIKPLWCSVMKAASVERSEYPGSYGSHPGAANCTSVLFELVYMKEFYQLRLQSAASTASLEDTGLSIKIILIHLIETPSHIT